MNKIFKVIYNKTRHCYVVVSELAKSHCKTAGSHTARNKTALTAAVLLALGAFSFVGMPSVQADGGLLNGGSLLNNDFVGANDTYYYYDEKDKEWKTYQYKATDIFNNRSRGQLPNYHGAGAKSPGAITAGLSAQAGQQTVTIGDRNAGASRGSVFIGEHSGYDDGADNLPKGGSNNYVTSVGFQSDATGWGSIAIGSNATAENSKKTDDVVNEVGNANTSDTVRDDTYSIETKPEIEGASVALGYNAHSKDGNIAIGAYSEATDTSSTKPYVSVGNSTLQRRITNVADGDADTDVATVGQMHKAIQSAGVTGWTLSTNGSTSGTAIKSGTTVDFSPAVDGKNGTADHKNVKISNNGSNVTIGLNKDIVLGEASKDKGGSLNVYSDSTEGNNKSSNVSITGSAVSVNKGLILSTTEDKQSNEYGYIAFKKPNGNYTYLHSAADAADNMKDRLEYSGTEGDATPQYIANLNDGITFTGDVNGTVPEGYTQTPTKLNTTLNITGGATTKADLTSGNIGVVSTPVAESADGTKTQASKLEIKLNKDLKGITSIGNQKTTTTDEGTTTTGAKIELGTNGTKISGGNVDVDNNKITGLGDGTNNSDAVNYKQLTEVKNSADNGLAGKANVNASNLTSDNVSAWQTKLGKGTVASSNAGLVTGGTVYSEVRPAANGNYIKTESTTAANLTALDTHVDTNTTDISNLKNLSNITDEGRKVIKKAAVGAVKVKAGDRITVTTDPEDLTDADTVTYKISAKNDGKVANGNTNLVSGDTVYKALQDQAKSLTYKGGWGINIDSSKKISLKNNLTTIIKNGTTASKNVKFNIDDTAMAIGGAIFNNSSWSTYVLGKTMTINSTGSYSVRIGGINDSTTGEYSTVTGGAANVASGYASSVNGGKNNTASGNYATVIGGGYNWFDSKDFPDIDPSIFGSDASAYRNDASGDLSVIVGGVANRASGKNSLIAGGINNKASGETASVFGGGGNTATGTRGATVSGGEENLSRGTYSSVFGGIANTNVGNYSTISGGYGNVIALQGPDEPKASYYGSQSSGNYGSAFGGAYNIVGGNGGTAVGGGHSVVYGRRSVGLAGGSTGLGANYALAAGYQSVVTTKGSKLVVSDKRNEFTDDYYYDNHGYAYKIYGKNEWGNQQIDFIPEYEDVATAVGYQATANEPNTISFGHDVDDVSGYDVKWKERTDKDKYEYINKNADGTINDYTKTPDIITSHYDTAKYNRLVKVADGIDNHDVVVMEQLRNADNVGKNAKNNVVVYKKNADGSLQVDEYGEAIIDVDASKAETEKATTQAIKDSEEAWGAALGTGSIAADNGQLVTGKTVYTYDAPVAEKSKTLKYVSADNTTGQNLASLDAHVAANADKIDELDKTKTHFYSVNSKDTNAGNYNNDGATGQNALAAGVGAVAKGESSVAIGTNSTATGTQAIAIGEKAKAGNQGIAVGANASAGYGQNMALGYYANVEGGVNNSTALGYGSKVTKSDILKRDGNNGVVSVGRSVGQSGEPGITRRIINVRAGFNDTDAVNVSQLKSAQTDLTNTGLTFAANSGADYTAKLGSKVTIQGTKKKDGHEYTADNLTTEIDDSGNITIKMDKNISAEKIAVNGKDGKNGQPGTAGSIGINGQDGQSGIGIDGKDGISIKGKDGSEGHIGLTGRDGSSADIIVKKGYDDTDKGINGTNGVDGKDGITRIVYKDATGEHQIATMEDGLKFKGDDDTVISKKLNNTLEIIGGAKGDLTEGNIGVKSTKDHQLKVQLAKDLTSITSISNQTTTKVDGKDVTTGAKITLGDDGSVDVNGGKITNVGSGADASGKYTTTTNAANIGDVQKIVKDAVDSASDTTNKALAGKANINASNIGANLKDASQEEKKDNAKLWGNAIGTGEIKDDDGRMVTGKTVYDEVRPENDGSYVKKDKTTGENLSALDTKIGKLDETKKYNYIDSKSTTSISDNLGKLDTQVKTNADNIANNTKSIQNITNNMKNLSENAVKYDGSDKSKVTLGGVGGTTITNVEDGSV